MGRNSYLPYRPFSQSGRSLIQMVRSPHKEHFVWLNENRIVPRNKQKNIDIQSRSKNNKEKYILFKSLCDKERSDKIAVQTNFAIFLLWCKKKKIIKVARKQSKQRKLFLCRGLVQSTPFFQCCTGQIRVMEARYSLRYSISIQPLLSFQSGSTRSFFLVWLYSNPKVIYNMIQFTTTNYIDSKCKRNPHSPIGDPMRNPGTSAHVFL